MSIRRINALFLCLFGAFLLSVGPLRPKIQVRNSSGKDVMLTSVSLETAYDEWTMKAPIKPNWTFNFGAGEWPIFRFGIKSMTFRVGGTEYEWTHGGAAYLGQTLILDIGPDGRVSAR